MKKAAAAFPHTLSMETPQALFYPVQALNQAMREGLTPLGQLLGLAVLWDTHEAAQSCHIELHIWQLGTCWSPMI